MTYRILSRILLLCSLLRYVSGSHILELDIENIEYASDKTKKQIISINGSNSTIGPTLRFHSGDKVNMLVKNNLHDPTSIHLHGVLLANLPDSEGGISNRQDGVPGVTQSAIMPGYSYWYNFTILESTCGTFWYHSHHESQYGDGLRGAMIVDCEEYDNHVRSVTNNMPVQEELITLSDWFNKGTEEILESYMSQHLSLDPDQDDTLFNGSLEDGIKLSIKNSETKYLLLRLINMATGNAQVFHIENHNLTIIEADGILTKPYTIRTLTVAVGQRYTVLVKLDPSLGNSKIFHASGSCAIIFNPFKVKRHWLSYDDNGDFDSFCLLPLVSTLPDYTDLELYDKLNPINHPLLPPPTEQLFMDYSYDIPKNTFLINGTKMSDVVDHSDPEHILLQGFVYKQPPIKLPYNTIIEIALNSNFEPFSHPWHLHGHSVQLVSIGDPHSGPLHWYDKKSTAMKKYLSDLKRWETTNTVPVVRDTFTIPENSYAVMRFKTDNPGFWVLHCHVEWHMLKGLGTVLSEGVDSINIQQLPASFQSSPPPITANNSNNTNNHPNKTTLQPQKRHTL
ncbi:putative oxidoreductase Ecym_1059 [Eremothecium cymbalariae DBVPG|uniref:Multicopper oxidase n=1 Tax=Eremothecium cymbalariae (strain CBS 270.75 / DBVPG 7215 / KCTC 17166 / NRRL Y-17582) TaxID=931890 RepID=G8JMA8_ERECY|nr:hypothetical protein Ecym_1059 [Eremothecium cymbalariae DBVPG\